ncbi:MAG: Release factor glutamine methyltransferase [Chlamydiae bacterium]|nr:Release factor glutamine methyltransferase [Chlamydiota bacterium]
MIIEEVAQQTLAFLEKKGISSARRATEEMLCHVLSLKRMDLYLDYQRPLNQDEVAACRTILSRLGKGEPIQYILGNVNFYYCDFEISPHVLIPRPETELLVDKIVCELKKESLVDKKLWDICCGSGCIGVSLKKALPELEVTLSDISSEAVALSKKNAQSNDVDVSVLEGDLFAPFQGKADFIVVNPPYVSHDEYALLSPSVKDFEPSLALIAGDDGCDVYRALARNINKYLNPGGKLWLEIGYQQGELVKEIFESEGLSEGIVEQDWSGHDRFFSLENE